MGNLTHYRSLAMSEEKKYTPPWEVAPTDYSLSSLLNHDELSEEEKDSLATEEDERPKTGPKAKHAGSMKSQRIAHFGSQEPGPAKKRRLERFVQEYVRDFQQTKAAIRAGLPQKSAQVQASEWMREPYTLRLIAEWLERVDEEVLLDRRRIIAGLWQEATTFGPGSSAGARVQALSKLAKITGMDIDRVQAEITFNHVMKVPGIDRNNEKDITTWEAQAQMSQEALTKHARD